MNFGQLVNPFELDVEYTSDVAGNAFRVRIDRHDERLVVMLDAASAPSGTMFAPLTPEDARTVAVELLRLAEDIDGREFAWP